MKVASAFEGLIELEKSCKATPPLFILLSKTRIMRSHHFHSLCQRREISIDVSRTKLRLSGVINDINPFMLKNSSRNCHGSGFMKKFDNNLEFNPSNATNRLLSSKAQGCKVFQKPSKPCHVGINWIALSLSLSILSDECPYMPGFQSIFRFFHCFVLAKLASSSILGLRVHLETAVWVYDRFKNNLGFKNDFTKYGGVNPSMS